MTGESRQRQAAGARGAPETTRPLKTMRRLGVELRTAGLCWDLASSPTTGQSSLAPLGEGRGEGG